MENQDMLGLVEAIKATPDYQSSDGLLRSLVLPWIWSELEPLEQSLSVTLPPDLRQVWNKTPGLVMFWDITHGQWGLVLWSPDQTRVRHHQMYRTRAERDWRRGDLIVGEFLGDTDLLVVRCDPESSDFGSVLIAEPIDPRDEWPVPTNSLMEFLRKFWNSRGEKFWQLKRE